MSNKIGKHTWKQNRAASFVAVTQLFTRLKKYDYLTEKLLKINLPEQQKLLQKRLQNKQFKQMFFKKLPQSKPTVLPAPFHKGALAHQ